MTSVGTSPAQDVIISIRGVSASYGRATILERVDLDIHRGEIVTLLGGSGSGKTTLLKQVLGLAKPDSGSIVINGTDITSCSGAQLDAVRRDIGVAFQGSALFNSLTVHENAALPLEELTALPPSIIELMVWLKLKAVGMADAARLYPRELSGGMRKRAAIARATALDPDILVLDEPGTGLDPIIAAGLDDVILFLNKAFGMTMLVVTHSLESAFRIATRMAMLYKGSLVAVGTPAEFKASTHPRVRQFLDGHADELGNSAADGFAASYLREFGT